MKKSGSKRTELKHSEISRVLAKVNQGGESAKTLFIHQVFRHGLQLHPSCFYKAPHILAEPSYQY